MTALRRLVPADAVSRAPGEEGWLAIRIEPARSAQVNRALAEAGVFASGLEAGNDLESLFLELTGAETPTAREGSFFGPAAAEVPAGWGQDADRDRGTGTR